MAIANLTGYQFFCIEDPQGLRDLLFERLDPLSMKGTILLAAEGINFSVSVEESLKEGFKQILFETLKQQPFDIKESPSEIHPNKRFLVKVRPEIVTIRFPGVDAACRPAPYIEPQELKKWLDENKDFILLDTRKKFEYEIGSFEKAINLGGHHFEKFPHEVEEQLSDCKEKTIVTFCTGGIRCEKGAPMMQLKGFKDVFQLRGGILKYFEECGGAHWRGDCFVFDHRAAVGPDLVPAKKMQCQHCRKTYDLEQTAKEIDGLRLLCAPCYKEWRELKDKGIRWQEVKSA